MAYFVLILCKLTYKYVSTYTYEINKSESILNILIKFIAVLLLFILGVYVWVKWIVLNNKWKGKKSYILGNS